MDSSEELKDLKKKVTLGLEEAYRKMVSFKKQKNSPLVISRNGRVAQIKPEDISPTTSEKNGML